MLLVHVLCRARVLLWQMVKRGELPEPKTAAFLAKLTPRGRVGSAMSEKDRKDPAKAKYMGECCGGTRIWGEGNATVYMDACALSPVAPVPCLSSVHALQRCASRPAVER